MKIAETIVDRGGDYILPVKENRATPLENTQEVFNQDQVDGFIDAPYDHARRVNKGHGRIKNRECGYISDPDYLARDAHKWKGLTSSVMVRAERIIGQQREVKTCYYISSLSVSAPRLLSLTRGHWNIENNLHWVLDIAFREDDCRVRKDNASLNFAVLRHMALNLLKQEKTTKGSIKDKRLLCDWNERTCSRLYRFSAIAL